MAEPKHVIIDLVNIRETAFNGIRRTYVFLGLGINAALDPTFRKYELADSTPIQLLPSNLPDETIAHFKTEFGLWIVANGLRELIETFALFLDKTHKACLTMACLKCKKSFKDARKRQAAFERGGIEDKLKALESDFKVRPKFPECINTIQQARNCFTHRRGIVGQKDCGDATELLLKWIGFDPFIELRTGETIDLVLPLKEPVYLKEEGTICLKVSERVRKYKIGAAVSLDPKELMEICYFMLMSTKELFQSVADFAKGLGIPDTGEIAPGTRV